LRFERKKCIGREDEEKMDSRFRGNDRGGGARGERGEQGSSRKINHERHERGESMTNDELRVTN